MPPPTSSGSTNSVGQSTSPGTNSLIAGDKWGGVTGTGVTLAYSFPWTSSGTATFFGRNGIGDYSSLNEQNATYHYGLSTTQQAAARSALQSWANVANIVFSEVAETSLNVGDIRFAWTSATDTSTGSQTWGWAYLPNSYLPSSGDVWISTANSKTATNSWAIGSSNFIALVHELGHALGLKHSFEGNPVLPGAQESQQYTVMSYTDHPHSLFVRVTPNADGSNSWNSFNVEPDTPMLYDVAAMQYLYGANLSYKTGNDVYTFDPGTPFIRTIWDAGGTDTISVSNFSKGSVVDLRPGHFSKITIESDSTSGFNWLSPPPTPSYDGTDNLAIAFGSIIENAIGGSGNDTLIGNDANNSLDGGGGNDTLYGGAGNDTFDWDASRRGGNDVFYGGTGDDVYVLDSSLDSIIEYSGEGTDTVWVVFSYSVSNLPNIENILAFGSTGVNLTGNAANNVIAGANGDDGITGGPGDDQIDGKGGVDTAYFDAIRSSYTITYSNLVYTLVSARDGTDTLTSVEYFSFLGVTVLAASSVDNFSTLARPVTLTGTSANESFTGGPGNDTIDGGAGIDTALYSGNRANYTLAKTSSGWVLSSASDGVDTLTNIERVKFADTSMALDISGNAGKAYRLYQAALDRKPDSGGLGDWIEYLDRGSSLADAAAGFVSSPEFKALYGANPSTEELVNKFYQTALHRAPEQAGFDYWVNQLNTRLQTVPVVLSNFSESPENQANLIGVIGNGISYTPWG
nr:DUF4214 domain-containing protein [Rhodoferax sp.]